MFLYLDFNNFYQVCDTLGLIDGDFAQIINNYGYPPFWSRPNTFESLVHIILEQQVSMASALAALNKVKEAIQEVTPARLLLLTDEELKGCYFSRQKMAYVRYLAEAILSGQINLAGLELLPDDDVRIRLTALKGIGNWTVDIYLMFVLHRADIFPAGDLAVVQSIKKVKALPAGVSKEELITIAQQWQPYRTVATMLLWHDYLSRRKAPPKPSPQGRA